MSGEKEAAKSGSSSGKEATLNEKAGDRVGDDTKQGSGAAIPLAAGNGDKDKGKKDEKQQQQSNEKERQPSGGVDRTPLHPRQQSYTVQFTFHRATNVPVSDFGKRSSDPYLLVDLFTSQKKRNEQDPQHRFRTPTMHRTTEPQWHTPWVVAGVPGDGFDLKIRLMDEDSPDMDDKLGKVKIHVNQIQEGWELEQQEYKVHKRGGSTKAYALRWCTSIHPQRDLHASLFVAAKVLGRTEERRGKTYTMNNFWFVHYSPMIGRIAGTKQNDDQGIERTT